MKIIFKFLSLMLATHLANATIYIFKPELGTVSFTAKGKPALIKIHGKGQGFQGKIQEENGILNGELKFELKTLKTGIELRDEHLHEKYLQTNKFPQATLKIQKLEKILPESKRPFEGLLTLHGVEQPVTGEISTSADNKTVTASFMISLSKFAIDIPSFQGLTVAEEVEVNIETQVTKSGSN